MKVFYDLLLGALLLLAGSPLTAQTLSIDLTDAAGFPGQVACVDMIGENFDDLLGIQFGLRYDTDALRFISGTATLDGVNVLIVQPASAPGTLRVGWNLFSATGFTSAPGAFDFGDLCFEVLQEGTSSIEFDSIVSPIEFTRADESIIENFSLTGGSITGNPRPDPTCDDGRRNGNETGVDCGGPDCAPCPDPTCDDGRRNGNETGVDCGGPDCEPCVVRPTCSDGVRNGNETGVDCGGSCAPCDTGGDDSCGAGSNEINICLGEVCDVPAGGQACVDITGTNFTDIVSFQFDVTYGGAELNFESVTFNPALNNSIPSNERSDGMVRIVYFDQSQSGGTLPDDGLIATLCFTNEGTTGTTLAAEELVIAATTGTTSGILNDGRVNGCQTSGTCNDGVRNGDETGVDCGGSCAPCQVMMTCGEDTDDVVICVSDVCADANQAVCVPIFVGNFDQLGGIQFELAYNTANLSNPEVRPAAELNQGTTAATFPGEGRVSIVWNDLNLTGATFPADRPAYELCFTAGNTNPTPLAFNNPGQTLRAFDAEASQLTIVGNPGSVNDAACGGGPTMPTCDDGIQNGNETGVDCGGSCAPCGGGPTMPACDDGIQNGNETGVDCGGSCAPCVDEPTACGEGSDAINICFGEACDAPVGSQVCVDITGTNFTDVVTFQFDVAYNGAELNFESVTFNPALNNSIPPNERSDGLVRIIYFDQEQAGATLPDGGLIATLCFTNEGTTGTTLTGSELTIATTAGATSAVLNDGRINGCAGGGTAPVITGADVRNPTCPDPDGGSISITVAGEGPFTFRWAGASSTTAVASGLSAGTYAVTVSDANGLSAMATYVLEPASTFSVTTSVNDVSCDGFADGVVEITTAGGTAPFTIDWEGDLTDGLLRQDNLRSGAYAFTVTDANGCTSTGGATITDPAPIVVTGTITDGGDDGVNIDGGASGGSTAGGVFRYAWTGPGGFTATTENVTGLTTPGQYCLTVTDSNGCTETECFTVASTFRAEVVSINPGCFGDNDATVNVTVSGGGGNYTFSYVLDGEVVATTEDLSNAAPGTYTLTVTSGDETVSLPIVVEPATDILPRATVTGSSGAEVGRVMLDPTGGSSPYTYRWGDGATIQSRADLAPGEYCVTITDANRCTDESCYTIGGVAPAVGVITANDVSCAGGTEGSVDLTITGGQAPFTIIVRPIDSTLTVTGRNASIALPTGAYTFVITDSRGNAVETTATITEPDAISGTASLISDAEGSDCSGSIVLSLAGGTPTYRVSWSSGDSTAALTGICAATYAATVTDANGCTFETGDLTIGRIDEQLVAVTDVGCGDSTGTVDVSITGGVAPYVYSWVETGMTDTLSTEEDLTDVQAGGYTLTVRDATGAALTRSYTVAQASGFAVDAVATSDFNGFNVSCNGGSDGRIRATATGDGVFTYEYFLGDMLMGADSVLTAAAAGEYTVRVTDAGGCEITNTVTLTEPGAIEVATAVVDASCAGVTDGSIDATVTGGSAPYAFSWSTGATDDVITGLSGGDYGLTVTDANGCTQTAGSTVGEPEDLVVTLEVTDATEGCNGSIRVLTLGGSGRYDFTYPNLPNQANEPLAEGLCPGTYAVAVTDANDCQTVTMTATILDRRAPCLSTREVITPNGDGLNETLVIFCSGEDVASDNTIEIYNRWGQLVYETADYDCSDNGGLTCFEGRTNDGELLPEGAYYYIFDYSSPAGGGQQQRGSFTILRD